MEYTIMDEMKYTIKDEEELILKYNKVTDNHLKLKSTLENLSEYELFIYITGKTYKYGRSLPDAIVNARYHIKGRRSVEKLFNHIDNTLIAY